MTYIPKFNDKRVQTRIRKAIGFTQALLSEDKPRPMSSRFIDRHFGISSNKLSRYLRDQLLTCVDENYNMETGVCKRYVINKRGINFLGELILLKKDTYNSLSHTNPSVLLLQTAAIEWAKEEYKQQLSTKNFEYEDKSNRLFNPIQNIRSNLRRELLAQHGLKYEYDISAAAPTMLYQYSFITPSATGEVLETIEYYLNNKQVVREKLAHEAELTTDQIKRVINGLFAGARLARTTECDLYQEIGCDYAKMTLLQTHPFILALSADIKTMWQPIKEDYPVRYFTDKNGRERKVQFNSKAKWSVYFELERKVLNCFSSYLKDHQNAIFLEHDGFTCEKPVDTLKLQSYIQEHTGLDINLELKNEKI